MTDDERNYFKPPVHDSDFLACEFRQSAEIFEGYGYGFGKGSTRRLQLVHDLLDGTIWWRCHFYGLWWF